MTTADHKAFDLVCKAAPLTAGQLAELTNLTTGAVTGLVNRLEQAGVVHRKRDPNDRRRVIIQPNPNAHVLIAVLDSLSGAIADACSRCTGQELAAILAFMRQIVVVFQAETAKLHQDDAVAEGP